MALASITDNGGSVIYGRLLAQTGAVTLNDTHVTKATCAVPVPSTPSTSTTSGGRSGDRKRCDTPTTPTCVEYFNPTPTQAPTSTPPVVVPGMPKSGGPILPEDLEYNPKG